MLDSPACENAAHCIGMPLVLPTDVPGFAIGSSADPAAAQQALINRIKTQIGPIGGAEDFGVDEIIDQRDTRALQIKTFAQSAPRRPDRNPPRVWPISPI